MEPILKRNARNETDMPCEDITEQIRITLDKEEKLLSYCLTKKACGKEIGSPVSIIDDDAIGVPFMYKLEPSKSVSDSAGILFPSRSLSSITSELRPTTFCLLLVVY